MTDAGPGRAHDLLCWFEHTLDLPRRNLARASLLFVCMFLVITSCVLGKVARDALFLSRFDARSLPWADLSVALLIGVVVAAYVRVSNHLYVRDLLAASMVFFSANCAAIWVVAHYYHPGWLYPIFYVWVGIFGVLAPTQVWTLANYVLTSREARRSFSIVGGGAIAGWIAAGFLTTALVRRLGTENLLLVMVLLLAISGGLVLVTWRLASSITIELERETSTHAPRNLRESADAVFSSSYLRTIAAVIFLSSFATTVIGWQFKAIASHFFVSKDALALFFGEFNLFAGLLSLAIQLLLTSRILKRFGIGPVLFCLPIALLAGSAAVVLSAGLFAIVLLRGADQVFRYSLDKPSVELLYLPVVARLKLQVKWFIDTVIWRAGDGLAAAALLMVVSYFGLPARSLGWVVALMAGLWGIAAWRARVLYMATLRHSIEQNNVELTHSSVNRLGRFASDLLLNKLRTGTTDEVLRTLDLLHLHRRPAAFTAVRALLSHSVPAIRAKALAVLADAGDGTVLPQARSLLSEPDPGVRDEAIRYLCRYSHLDPLTVEQWPEFRDSSLRSGIVEFLARPGATQNLDAARRILTAMVDDPDSQTRLAAAQVLATVPDAFDPLLARLLTDRDATVASHAIRAVAALGKRQLVRSVLGRAGDPACRTQVAEALVSFGDAIADELGDILADPRTCRDERAEVASALNAIGTQQCADILQSNILEPDATVRYAIIHALAALRRSSSAVAIDPAELESLLVAEVYGNYRTFQVCDAFQSADIRDATLTSLLEEGLHREQERIFRILSTLYPRRGFRAAYEGLQSSSVLVHDNALEFLDNLLKPSLRQLLVPLLDSGFTPAARADIATRLLSVEVQSIEEAIVILLGSGEREFRICATRAIGLLCLRDLQPLLDGCLNDSDSHVRQSALEARRRLQPCQPGDIVLSGANTPQRS